MSKFQIIFRDRKVAVASGLQAVVANPIIGSNGASIHNSVLNEGSEAVSGSIRKNAKTNSPNAFIPFIFDSNFFGSGEGNTDGPLQGIRNVRLVRDLSAHYAGRGVSKVYLLNYDFIFENGRIVRGHDVIFGKETMTGLWKFIGDPVELASGGESGVSMAFGGNYGSVFTCVNISVLPIDQSGP